MCFWDWDFQNDLNEKRFTEYNIFYNNICKRGRLDLFASHDSIFQGSTVHVASSGIEMSVRLRILMVMTKEMLGMTKGTCHRNWLKKKQNKKNSQIVNHKEALQRIKVKGTSSPCGLSHQSIKAVLIQTTTRPEKKGLDTQTLRISATCSTTAAHTHHLFAWGQSKRAWVWAWVQGCWSAVKESWHLQPLISRAQLKHSDLQKYTI